jgi:hypothetical protein
MIVAGCLRREPGIDFLSAHEARLEGVLDPDVLAFATQQNRILVTSDLRTMPRHFGDFVEANGQCAGVFLVKQRVPWPMSLRLLCWYGPLRKRPNGTIGSWRFLSRNNEPRCTCGRDLHSRCSFDILARQGRYSP